MTADERYVLFVDGQRAGRGTERGDPANWFVDTYETDLAAGPHVIVALVWSLGPRLAPMAQMSAGHGFLLQPAGDSSISGAFGTGLAPWQARAVSGIDFIPVTPNMTGVGPRFRFRGDAWPHDPALGTGDAEWVPVTATDRGQPPTPRVGSVAAHTLRPALLPPMLDRPFRAGVVRHIDVSSEPLDPVLRCNDRQIEHQAWHDWWHGRGGAIVIPPRTDRRILFDLQDYYCAYPCLSFQAAPARASALRGPNPSS
ncbi:MAG TPA: hypothetical protein VK324_03510 [Tepidisphaeraceae bacterium]|nr:hypothetical protein [Tepidisphaeraceae bacterium]